MRWSETGSLLEDGSFYYPLPNIPVAHGFGLCGSDATKVTFDWTDAEGARRAAHRFESRRGHAEPIAWNVPTGHKVHTRWVEFTPDYRRP